MKLDYQKKKMEKGLAARCARAPPSSAQEPDTANVWIEGRWGVRLRASGMQHSPAIAPKVWHDLSIPVKAYHQTDQEQGRRISGGEVTQNLAGVGQVAWQA